jgi:hypothetical protein
MMQCNTGRTMDEIRGDGTKKWMARRRIGMANGNISSYCRVLFSKDQLAHMNEVVLMSASVAEVNKESEATIQRRLNKRKQDAEDKKKKDAEKKATTERKSIESKPKCADLMDEIKDKGCDHVREEDHGWSAEDGYCCSMNLIRLPQIVT